MIRAYPIVIHKDADSDYGVTVPDLPGCFSAGSTFEEALAMTREAIEGHVEALADHGYEIPLPGAIEQHRTEPLYADGIWALVEVDLSASPTSQAASHGG